MFLSSITLQNILSFKKATLKLGSLNVLIGPNGAGKSNLIDCIRLLKAAPADLNSVILNGGGAREWIWKGEPAEPRVASLQCKGKYEQGATSFLYELKLREVAGSLVIEGERLVDRKGVHFDRTGPQVKVGKEVGQVPASHSVLSVFKNPVDPTPITRLGQEFDRIKVYKEFNTGLMAHARTGVSTYVIPKEFLVDDGHNLALVLQEMIFDESIGRIRDFLPRFCEQFEDVRVRLDAGIAQTYMKEKGLYDLTPAIRLSDGTLKFLCLLTILLHPKPPSLVCIEEPELGLHPDALQLVAEAIVDASERTQLIVTTHSDALIDALTDRPETVVVCEHDPEDGTQFERLKPKELKAWLKRYKLGALWRKGEIGGNRW